ncbi:MAG: lipid-binding SYLF domain-containing protein [Phycisphaeraceae bacterium]|nr:lipid-binding SYLF domain-containing protein [Phycisphaeraceae bacterium]
MVLFARAAITGLLIWSVAVPGCATAPGTEKERVSLANSAADALARMKFEDTGLDAFIKKSYGYAIFPAVGKGALGIGGAYGRGEVYELGQMVGYCDLTQATLGLQAGGQEYSELICFENRNALDRFREGQFAFSANASATALRSGAAATAKFADGVAVFTYVSAGLMFEASIGGQQFSFQPR